MGFALRINYVDVVVSDSLKNYTVNDKVVGYQFDMCLSYYRGIFLTFIDEFTIRVDGKEVAAETIKLCINDKEFSPIEFERCYSEFWQVIEPATVRIYCPGGLAKGEHNIDVTMFFRSPYIPTGPNHQYMPIDSCGSKMLTMKG